MDTVYIETSIVSHATARPSREPQISMLQQHALDWRRFERTKFTVVTSQLVLDEAALGDVVAAAERMRMLADVPLITIDQRVEDVAAERIARSLMPAVARVDALHVACAAVGRIQFLLTQNCRHIANAHTLPRVYRALDELGYPGLLIWV